MRAVADVYCERVAESFGRVARLLRALPEVLREAGLDVQAELVQRAIAECEAGALATYEETTPRGHPTGRLPIQE